MRPVRLDIDGFASFRERATIDFTDADFFVLVGPTGSGKSTVIDAMTFALYGSAPRWSDRRIVAYGLAPTAAHGKVRLVFDAAGQRYAVARELRRTKTNVTVRNARLDRFVDPTTTDFDSAVTSVAADGETTAGVQALLGLSFDHFCQCVVLPQGQFSDFLRASGKERREILLNLLGADIYAELRRRANERAAVLAGTVTTIDARLLTLADATDEAVAAAAVRVTELTALQDRIGHLLDDLDAAGTRLADHRATVTALDGELRLLAALAVPTDLASVESERAATAAHLAAVRATQGAAEATDSAARSALAAGPNRSVSERLQHDHRRLADVVASMPGFAKAAADADALRVDAVTGRVRAAAELAAGQDRRARSAAAATEAGAAAATLRDEIAALATVVVPADAADVDAAEQSATADLLAAVRARQAADAAEQEASAAVQAMPTQAELEHLIGRHTALAAAVSRRTVLAGAQDAASAARERAVGVVEQARAHTDAARAALAHARTENVAATLRPHLEVGGTCPVCDQAVHELPPALDAATLADAEATLVDAETTLDDARSAESSAVADDLAAAGRLADLDDQLATLTADLTGQPDEGVTRSTLAELAGLTDAAVQARTQARTCRQSEDSAREKAEKAATASAGARSALGAAREAVLALQPPSVDDGSLLSGWTTLREWADAGTAGRNDRLPAAETDATTTAAALAAAETDLAAAVRDLDDAYAAETEAVTATRLAGDALARAVTEQGALAARLDGRPGAEQVAADLARLDTLEAAARTADDALRTARAGTLSAAAADAAAAGRYDEAWQQVRAARDRLAALDAPAVAAGTVSEAWSALAGWAHGAGVDRTERVRVARADAADAADAVDRVATDLRGRFADAGVPLPDTPVGVDLARVAPAAAAAARQAAVGEHDDLVQRRSDAEQLLVERTAAESARQVAHLLGNLLQSTRFPAWLEATALDTLVVDASESLTELSNGQFSLTHRDGDFYVVDHTDADMERSVRTLSGGETFQASLALALALSSHLSTMAVAGAARLDSIFLDEGFGTLDPDSLELVAQTLENLAKKERMVGVVTHVAALADRIPVRFTVSRDNRSSRLVREGS